MAQGEFTYDYYKSPYVGTIADLIGKPGEIAARAALASGAEKAGIAGTIGNTIQDLAQYRADAPKRELQALQLTAARREGQQQQQADVLTWASQALPQVNETNYPAFLSEASKRGLRVDGAPPVFDPAWKAQELKNLSLAMTPAAERYKVDNPTPVPVPSSDAGGNPTTQFVTPTPGAVVPGRLPTPVSVPSIGPDGKPATNFVVPRPGLSVPSPPARVTFDAPQLQIVNGVRTLIRPGSDGKPYDVFGRALPPDAKIEPVPEPESTVQTDKGPQRVNAAGVATPILDAVGGQPVKAPLPAQMIIQNQPLPSAPDIPVDSKEFKIAQDLAYGKLTFADFNKLYPSMSRDPRMAALKQAVYLKAGDLNPNFSPAQFEMGFKLASNPKVQQQMASFDNVNKAVPDLLKLSDEAERTGVTALNRLIVKGGFEVGGQHYTDFTGATKAFADELSGALGFGNATDMKLALGVDLTNPNLSPSDFRSMIQSVVIPFVNRKRASLLGQMGVYGQPGQSPAAISAQPAPPVAPKVNPFR